MPWTSKDALRHTHKAKSPAAQRQWEHVANGALAHRASEKSAIMQANGVVANRHANQGGAMAHLPVHALPKLAAFHQSPLGSIAAQRFGGISHPTGSFGAHARMPRIPIADTLRNIASPVHGAPKNAFDTGGEVPRGSSSPGSPGVLGAASDAIEALRRYLIENPRREIQADRERFEDSYVDNANQPAPKGHARGGSILEPAAVRALQQAIKHLQGLDAGSAAAALRSSPHAMAHPDVAAAEAALRTHQGVAPAQKTLMDLRNANNASKLSAPIPGKV
jgi:hypothetical protein